MKKYDVLLNVLDQIRLEAPSEFTRYRPQDSDQEKLDQARSRAYIHLFLKVWFGLLDFKERENCLCDGAYDGGVDAYHIDRDNKKIYFIQSKFRTTSDNFECKNIDLRELVRIDVDRITKGMTEDEQGNVYNGKVQGLIRAIQNIEDNPRYKFIIILLANIESLSATQLRRLVGDLPIEHFDNQRCYNELLLPVVSGTYYNSSDLMINIDLTKKEVARSRIEYTVNTGYSECEITILFVPTIEIAKVLNKYKNSILKSNPRSYLTLSTNKVNQEIANTVLKKTGNEFALFNNGITMLSDETLFTERTGRPYLGQLMVKNPQIINGGQTAYTLSHLYVDAVNSGTEEEVFSGKEVMLKVITFVGDDVDDEKRFSLIKAISKATNQQTSVVEADRRSNEKVQLEIQEKIYRDFGYFYERKKGEFFDGLRSKYISRDMVIDRELLLRVALAISGSPEVARRTSSSLLFLKGPFDQVLHTSSKYRDLFFAYLCYRCLEKIEKKFRSDKQNRFGVVSFGNALRYGKYSVVYISHARLQESIATESIHNLVEAEVGRSLSEWISFEESAKKNPTNHDYFRKITDPLTGNETIEANFDSYYKVNNVKKDLDDYFGITKDNATV